MADDTCKDCSIFEAKCNVCTDTACTKCISNWVLFMNFILSKLVL